MNNLHESMIRFTKPRRAFENPEDFRRQQTAAREMLAVSHTDRKLDCITFASLTDLKPASRLNGTNLDAAFYKSDPIGLIPSDLQSLKSQATYSSGLPSAFGKVSLDGSADGFSGYASSVMSQDINSDATSTNGSMAAFSQSDRLQRRGSFDTESGLSSTHDDMQSQHSSSATEF